MAAAQAVTPLHTVITERRGTPYVLSSEGNDDNGKERKLRIRRAIRQGQLYASEDVCEGEYYTQSSHLLMMALFRAHGLKPTEYQFILCVHMHSRGMQSLWAVCDPYDHSVPSLADWCAWLDWQSAQVCNVRRELLAANVIVTVDDDPNRLAVNEQWETWDPLLFARHVGRRNAGGPNKPRPRRASTHATQGVNYVINAQEDDTPVALITHSTDVHQVINAPFINQLMPSGPEPRPQAARDAALKNKEKKRRTTEANASGADDAAPAPFPVAQASSQPRRDPETESAVYSVPPSKLKRSRPRKLTDEQLAAHNTEQEYLRKLLDGLKEVIGWKGELPQEGRQKTDARWFLTAAPDGGPVPLEEVIGCYRMIKASEYWRLKPVGVAKLAELYVQYCTDPDGFRAANPPATATATTRQRTAPSRATPARQGRHGPQGLGSDAYWDDEPAAAAPVATGGQHGHV